MPDFLLNNLKAEFKVNILGQRLGFQKTTEIQHSYLNNGISMLNEPGEWFLDRKKAKIYYIPRAGENMNSAKVTVPVLENLVEVKGTIGFSCTSF